MITPPRDLHGAAGDEPSVAQEFVISERFTAAVVRISCVLGMFSSLGVQVPCPT
jgi:hypothetical protein